MGSLEQPSTWLIIHSSWSLSHKCKVHRSLQQLEDQNSCLLACLSLSASSKKAHPLEQQLFSTCAAHVPCLAAAPSPPRGSIVPRRRKRNRALLLSGQWNLFPRLLSISQHFIAFISSEQPEGRCCQVSGWGSHLENTELSQPTAHSATRAVLTSTDLQPRGKIRPQRWGNCKEDEFPSWNSSSLKTVSSSGSPGQNDSCSDTQ